MPSCSLLSTAVHPLETGEFQSCLLAQRTRAQVMRALGWLVLPRLGRVVPSSVFPLEKSVCVARDAPSDQDPLSLAPKGLAHRRFLLLSGICCACASVTCLHSHIRASCMTLRYTGGCVHSWDHPTGRHWATALSVECEEVMCAAEQWAAHHLVHTPPPAPRKEWWWAGLSPGRAANLCPSLLAFSALFRISNLLPLLFVLILHKQKMGYSHYAPPQAPYGQQPPQYGYGQYGNYYGQQQPQVVYVQQPQQPYPQLRGGGGGMCLPCLAGLGLGCCLDEMCCGGPGDCCCCII
ncbi:hypothetical protein GQ54DRAFT_70012 [Martensiomyces pterosporus]|nr:hypothetical protein GQ54DRAFT_70012 [Martensiomyces pterosporus]